MNLRQLLQVTDGLSDGDFETLIGQVRTVRQARREGAAYERQMAIATDGISTRYSATVPALAENRNLDAAMFEVRVREQACLSADAFERRVREITEQRW
jgi:hypothetical protein